MRFSVSLFALALLFSGLNAAGQASPADSNQNQTAPPKTEESKPKAPDGGVQILSDTEGVNFKPWLARWHFATAKAWDPLIPKEVNAPTFLKGEVMIRFKILPDGRIMDHSMVLEGRSGTDTLDRAAWGALTGAHYPPLPKEFRGPYFELRAWFLYNEQPSR